MAILPTSRAHLTTKPRSDFSAAGGDSTFHGTFTNVPLPDPRRTPMISRKDMDFFRICEATNTHQSTGNTAACPRFGERSKSTEFWKHLLAAFDIMAVVDLTPRSRALAVEAMRGGAPYLGVCFQPPTHLTWLQNEIDREALALISGSGTPLCQQEFAEHIQGHYKDILEELTGRAELSDLEPSGVDANGS